MSGELHVGEQQRAAVTDSMPLKCICNLCSCGGHRCADFNLATDQQAFDSTCLRHSMKNDNGNYMVSSRRREMSSESDRCDQERYLPTGVTRGRTTGRPAGQQEDEHHYARSSGTTQGQVEPDRKETDQTEGEHELLHVLVTRPELASKPRDNILFEGDMDLRTTFETSYEALARMRLDHWKSRDDEAQRQRAGGNKSHAATAVHESMTNREHVSDHGNRDTGCEHQLATSLTRIDDNEQRADVHTDRAKTTVRKQDDAGQLIGARMIRSPARLRGGDSLVGTGLALGQVQHRDQLLMQQEYREHARDLNSPAAPSTSTGAARCHTDRVSADKSQASVCTSRPKHGQSEQAQIREQTSLFVDPDLSSIIVYDANLNRLERVGMRKRSKYRPSTSLRPGGRAGFFGQSLDEEGRGQPVIGQNDRPTESQAIAELDQLAISPTGVFCLTDGPAGNTSENLNRNRTAGGDKCGRKHNMTHVNRVDHIKQFNLVDNTEPNVREFKDKATLTEGESTLLEQERHQEEIYGNRTDKHHRRQESIYDEMSPEATDERILALAEEATAVAELQRVTSLGPESCIGHDARTPTDVHRDDSSSDPEATSFSSPNVNNHSSKSPQDTTHNSDGLAEALSRKARMQRVCQNQSFNIHENEYPEIKEDNKLTSSIKIGGRETVDLVRGLVSNDGQSRQSMTSPHNCTIGPGMTKSSGRLSGNLFRESPDFVLTTTNTRGRDAGEGELDPMRQTTANCILRNSNLHVEFDGREDLKYEQAGHETYSNEGACFRCRVLDLDHFEFVGERSGHKYFVETHLKEEKVLDSEMT